MLNWLITEKFENHSEREGLFGLFDLIASGDKRLHAYPGKHVESGPEALQVHGEFLGWYFE